MAAFLSTILAIVFTFLLSSSAFDILSVGTRVRRGPDWQYGLQDGGGNRGTVLEVRPWQTSDAIDDEGVPLLAPREAVAAAGGRPAGAGVLALRVVWDHSEEAVNVYRWNPLGDHPRDLEVVERVSIGPTEVEALRQRAVKTKHRAASRMALTEAARASDIAALRRILARIYAPLNSGTISSGSAPLQRPLLPNIVDSEGNIAPLFAVQPWENQGGDPCLDNWPGIRCEVGEIIAIDVIQTHYGSGQPFQQQLPPVGDVDARKTGPLFSAIIDDLVQLEALESLRFAYASLRGPIPQSLCRLRNLQFLSLEGNTLMGPLPSCLGDMPRLKVLSLHANDLQGPIPESFARAFEKDPHQQTLNMLSLHGNTQLTASPQLLARLREIQTLSLPVGIDRPHLMRYIHEHDEAKRK